MKHLFIVAFILALTACEYSEADLDDGPGIYVCKSNSGRPTLTLDSSTLKITRINLGEFILKFVDLKSQKTYKLHSTLDRDYNCEKEE